VVDSFDDAELSKLIKAELDLGFAYLGAAITAGTKANSDQAFRRAKTAYDTAARLLARIGPESSPDSRARLANLADALELLSK
jgi:hypothetical protein